MTMAKALSSSGRHALGLLAALAATAGTAADARAQTQLPGIVITTPSPVAPSAPAQAPQATQSEPPAAPLAPSIVAPDAFVPLTVVPSREIAGTTGVNLADSLQYKPGIAGSTFAPGANRPVIRGLDNYRVRVQENGIGAHDMSALSEDHSAGTASSASRS